MKVDSNKGIYPDFVINILDGYRDYNDELPLFDMAMNLLPRQLQSCFFVFLSSFDWNLSYNLLKVLVPASYLPTLITSSEN